LGLFGRGSAVFGGFVANHFSVNWSLLFLNPYKTDRNYMKNLSRLPYNPVSDLPESSLEAAYASIEWALSGSRQPIVTTNFKPYSAVLLHALTRFIPDIPVLWIDTQFNTEATLDYVKELSSLLALNLKTYQPDYSRDQIEVRFNGIPELGSKSHSAFTEMVKLNPFKRALRDHNPDLWFTNIRKGQTAHRDSLDIVSISNHGILKVSPFYYWSSKQLAEYAEQYDLPLEWNHNDPTKGEPHRECGIQF
jgi:phosphoadenosine phosphosulfate reductase